MSFLNIGHKLERVMGKEQELLDAARLGNVAAIEKLLSNKPRKSTVGGASRAIEHVGHKLHSFFKSVNVDCTDKNGYTPLHHAAVNGHREAVECLLRAEAQPKLVDNNGCNPVHLAAWSGKPEIVLLLLNAGTVEIEPGVPSPVEPVHVNQQNGSGDTALHSAAQYGHCAVVDVLLQKYANPTIRNLKEESPLDLAAQYGRKDVVQRVLISHPELSQRPECTQSPLHLASRNGHKDIVEVLLNNKFDIQAKTDTGTALHEAALHGKLDVVKLLLEEGIDVNCQDSQGRTALQLLGDHQAQQKSYTEITNVIIEYMNKSNRVQEADAGLYETLSTCTSGSHGDKPTATVKPLPQEKPAMADSSGYKRPSPDKPTPAPRSSMIQLSPDHPTGPTTVSGLYSRPNKNKADEEAERVASSTSMLGSPEAPPLPPRISVFQTEPPPPPSEPSVQPASGSFSKPHLAPKKPPRRKNSPQVSRRTAAESSPPNTSSSGRHLDLSRMTESSPTPPFEPISETSHIPDDTRTIPENSRSIPNVTHTEADISNTSSQHSKLIDQPDSGIGSGFNQSDFNNANTDQFKETMEHSSDGTPVMSPTPAQPPRELGPLGGVDPNMDASVNPQTGVPVNQGVYMEMTSRQSIEQSGKPVCDVKPEPVSEKKQELTADDMKVDSYGILFPKFKNDSPRKKPGGLVRSNTTPEENVYVGPDPITQTEKFKEKQGLLRRTNTAPEDHEFFEAITTEKSEQGTEGQVKENEYAEIGEKSPPPTCSPGENIYETIRDTKPETESVYSQIWTVSSDVSAANDTQKPSTQAPLIGGNVDLEDSAKVSNEQVGDDTKDVTSAVVTEVGDTSNRGGDDVIIESKPTGCIKPTYLEFVKKRSSVPLTPTGYVQPPTPEFPPPSPATAMMGIEMKIQEMDAKRKSRDITTATDLGTDEQLDIAKEQYPASEVKVTAQTVKGYSEKGSGDFSENQNSNNRQTTSKHCEDVVDKADKLTSSATVLPIVSAALTDDQRNHSTVPSIYQSSFPPSAREADSNSEQSVINISDQNFPNKSSIPKNQSVIESEAAGSKLLEEQSDEEDMADKPKPVVPRKPSKKVTVAGNQSPVVPDKLSTAGNQSPVVPDKPVTTAGNRPPVVPDKPASKAGNQLPVVPEKAALKTENQAPAVPDKPASIDGNRPPVVPDRPASNTGNQAPALPDRPASKAGSQTPLLPDKPASTAGNEPPVVPDKAPVVPDKPPVVPDKPPVVPDKPPLVPDKPASTAGNEPPVVPDKPPVVPDKPTSIATNQKPVSQDKPAPPETASPVMMRKKSSTASNPDMDMFKVGKEIQSLLRGSVIAGPTRIVSKFYEDVLQKAKTNKRASVPPLAKGDKSSPMEADEDIDVDQVMTSIDVEVARRSSQHDSAKFDDTEEWAQIEEVFESFGAGMARVSVFMNKYEKAFEKFLAGSNHVVSVREWLESIGQGHYENAFIANGFDNVDFLDPKVLEEQDLEQIGVLGHEDRRQILDAARSLPVLTPLDPDNQPASVEEWLMSLQLVCYLDTFESSGYDTMEKVESILWDLQLRTVLDISMLGHRKRILASLGERHPPTRQNNSLRRQNLSTSPDVKSPYLSLDLYKDYNNIKPHSSSEEDIDKTTQMAIDSSEDEDVFNRKSSTSGSSSGGQSIRNKDITLRPPHMAQTQSPAKQWRHKPDMLIKGCCNYTAQYLGSTIVADLTGGTDSTRAGITKLKKSTDVLAKIPVILLSISYKGVKFIDAKSKKVICDHEIGNIFCACQDTENLNFFAYITRDIQTGQHYCHVFSVKSASLAHDIILTLGESFEVAYQMALKEKANAGAMELDRKMSSTSEDPDDLYSVVHKKPANTNTV